MLVNLMRQLLSLPSPLRMSASQASVRQRGQNSKKATPIPPPIRDDQMNGLETIEKRASTPGSEWDYKIALAVITALAFATRFWGIGHPNEVVFDEVHFGKVGLLQLCWTGVS